jgi:DNA-binding PadR family transcriptional regulator
MYETKNLRCLSYIRKRCVLQRADKLLRFRVVWNEAGRTTSCVGVIPSREVRDSFAHPRRRGNRRQSRCSARLDKCPGTAYHAAVNMSLHDASRDRGMQNGGVMGGGNVPGKRSSDPGDLLPLTPVALNVLLALADGERHGYGIMLEVRERTGGRVRLGPGTLYGAVKRLKEGGVIEESGERPDSESDDERRRYYRLTGFGGEVLAAEVERLDGLVRAARRKGAFPAPKPSAEGA